ncbi:MAG: hypothetical protein SGJ24_05405 [Chloroflexota bacterium]|nr:hypothetical protein [Chloroflexota bacterium]
MKTPTLVDRKHAELLYKLFDKFALDDQRAYYIDQVNRNRTAAAQVNVIRAIFAFLTGLAAALAGLIVLLSPAYCVPSTTGAELALLGAAATDDPSLVVTAVPPDVDTATESASDTVVSDGCNLDLVIFLLVLAVVAPALGGAFGTLADLYQWDRLVKIYELAADNLEVADAKSPIDSMTFEDYRITLKAYAEGTLAVMRDETAQWGQIIRTPESIDNFIRREQERVQTNVGNLPQQVQDAVKKELDELRAAAAATERRLQQIRDTFGITDVPPPPTA